MGKDKGRTKKQKPFSYRVRQGKDKGKTVKNKTLFSKRVEEKKRKKKEKKRKRKKKKNILWSYSELLNAIHNFMPLGQLEVGFLWFCFMCYSINNCETGVMLAAKSASVGLKKLQAFPHGGKLCQN